MSLGFWELMIIMGIVIIVFGSSKLPKLGSAMAEGLRNFKKGVKQSEIDNQSANDNKKF